MKYKILWIDNDIGYGRSQEDGDIYFLGNEIKDKKVGDIVDVKSYTCY